MREAISNTAELGATLGGPRLVDPALKARMRDMLRELGQDAFARTLSAEAASGYPTLKESRRIAQGSALEAARRSLGR
jgi:ketol-acid reductoisomerase